MSSKPFVSTSEPGSKLAVESAPATRLSCKNNLSRPNPTHHQESILKRLCQLAFCALLVTGLFITPSLAQEKTIQITARVAVIDIRKIQGTASVYKDIRTQIIAYRDAFRVDIQNEEKELRKASQELARQRSILSPEAFAEERKAYDQRLAEVQRKLQNRKKALDKVKNDALRVVQTTLNEIVGEVARKNNLILILSSEQVVYALTQLDITDIIVKEVDVKLPKLKVASPGK